MIMKNSLYVVFILFVFSIAFASCEKEGGNTKGNKLEGTVWVFEKQEALLGDEVVKSDKSIDYTRIIMDIVRIQFEDANATVEYEGGGKSVYPYSYSDNEVIIGSSTYKIVSNKLVHEVYLGDYYGEKDYSGLKQDEILKIFTFGGETIFLPKGRALDYVPFSNAKVFPMEKLDSVTDCFFYSSNRKPCLIKGLRRLSTEYPDVQEYLKRYGATEYVWEWKNDKEFLIYHYVGEKEYYHPLTASTITLDYPYDYLRNTYTPLL